MDLYDPAYAKLTRCYAGRGWISLIRHMLTVSAQAYDAHWNKVRGTICCAGDLPWDAHHWLAIALSCWLSFLSLCLTMRHSLVWPLRPGSFVGWWKSSLPVIPTLAGSNFVRGKHIHTRISEPLLESVRCAVPAPRPGVRAAKTPKHKNTKTQKQYQTNYKLFVLRRLKSTPLQRTNKTTRQVSAGVLVQMRPRTKTNTYIYICIEFVL